MRYVTLSALLLVGIVHLLPAVGAMGPSRLFSLYSVEATEPNLQLLLRHRAVLFGMLGIAMLASLWLPALRVPALLLALASVSSFLLLAWLIGGYNSALATVVHVDLALLPVILVGMLSTFASRPEA